jgi:hypothetical protein
MRYIGLVLWAAFATATGCSSNSPLTPRLCLLTAAALGGQDPSAVSCPEEHNTVSLAAGEAYYIRHELPEGLDPIGPLHVLVTTPCSESEELNVEYGLPVNTGGEGGFVAIVARTAPTGAECSLVVTASIANSSLTAATKPMSDGSGCSCLPADAGVDSGVDANSDAAP